MIRIIVTEKSTNIITNIVDTTEIVSNGLLVKDGEQEYILGFYKPELYNIFNNVDIPDGTIPQQYCYDGTTFTVNPNYIEYKTPEEQISDLQSVIADLTAKLNDKGLIP